MTFDVAVVKDTIVQVANSVPAMTTIAVIAGCCIFRDPLSRLIDRTRVIGSKGIEAEFVPNLLAAPQVTLPNPTTKPLPIVVPATALVDLTVKGIKDSLALEGLEPEQKVERALQLAASVVVSSSFDRVYFLIYGSQFHALMVLNAQWVKDEDLKSRFYDQAAKLFPEDYKTIPYDDWRGFLTKLSLIQPAAEGQWTISDVGRDFVTYAVKQGYSVYKPH